MDVAPHPSYMSLTRRSRRNSTVFKVLLISGVFSSSPRPLRQVAVHIAVLPTEIIAEGRCGRDRERAKKSEKSKSPRVAHGMHEFVEIHTLEHPGTRREPFLRLLLCPRDIPPRRFVGVGRTDGWGVGGGVTASLLLSALAFVFDIFRWGYGRGQRGLASGRINGRTDGRTEG
jgi:hypothetical protein